VEGYILDGQGPKANRRNSPGVDVIVVAAHHAIWLANILTREDVFLIVHAWVTIEFALLLCEKLLSGSLVWETAVPTSAV